MQQKRPLTCVVIVFCKPGIVFSKTYAIRPWCYTHNDVTIPSKTHLNTFNKNYLFLIIFLTLFLHCNTLAFSIWDLINYNFCYSTCVKFWATRPLPYKVVLLPDVSYCFTDRLSKEGFSAKPSTIRLIQENPGWGSTSKLVKVVSSVTNSGSIQAKWLQHNLK